MPAWEKIAWVWLVTMVVTYGAYFTTVALGDPNAGVLERLWVFGITAVIQMAIMITATVVIWRQAGGKPERDERDRAIGRRAGSIAYFVMMAGTIVVGVYMPFKTTAVWQLVNAALLAIVIAEIVHSAMVVVGYRRGWR